MPIQVARQSFEVHGTDPSSPSASDERVYLKRILQVLEVVAASALPINMSEVCRRLDLPMTTVHRLLVTLWRMGVLNRDARRRYTMGDRLVVLPVEPDPA